MQGTRLEVDLQALEHNFKYLKSKLDPGVLFMAVVKANAYGHGIIPISKKLEELGTDYFAVAYTEEAVEMRHAGINKPILVLHPQSHTLVDCIHRCIDPVIYSVKMLEDMLAFAKAESQKNYPIHLEFNTGLNRIGIEIDELDQVLELLSGTDALKVKGVQSHLAASEDHKENDFTLKQLEVFENIAQKIEEKLGYAVIKHTDNTSGILNYKSGHHNMVRSGIGLYGYGNDLEHDKHLKTISSLKSQISQLRKVKKGASISYNRSHRAASEMTIAVVALGHGDGINRIYGYGNARVKINGLWAPTLGIICMDMFMVDVSGIDCKVGDEVVIFGKDQTARDLAEAAGTISYELLTGIQKRVARVYLNKQ